MGEVQIDYYLRLVSDTILIPLGVAEVVQSMLRSLDSFSAIRKGPCRFW